jgi:polysaccharide biosynthesis protein PslA
MLRGAWRERLPRPWFERFGDLLVACGLIILSLPLMVIVAIAIKCDSRGPVLLWEKRRGPDGRWFWGLKFRCTEALSAHVHDESKTTFVGGIIYTTRLDTLPQLFNVLRGDMTCRPADPDHLFFLD